MPHAWSHDHQRWGCCCRAVGWGGWGVKSDKSCPSHHPFLFTFIPCHSSLSLPLSHSLSVALPPTVILLVAVFPQALSFTSPLSIFTLTISLPPSLFTFLIFCCSVQTGLFISLPLHQIPRLYPFWFVVVHILSLSSLSFSYVCAWGPNTFLLIC